MVSITFISAICLIVSSLECIDSVIPVIDLANAETKVVNENHEQFCSMNRGVADEIDNASKHVGFFYVTNHGVPHTLLENLYDRSQQFFSLPMVEKRQIDMKKGGKAWRGYFAVGDEETSGIPDQKEGIYFGTELDNSHPFPLHGANLWLESSLGAEMKLAVLDYMSQMKRLGQHLMRLIVCNTATLQPENINKFQRQFELPTELFRIFNYPPHNLSFPDTSMAVGEHTDYGYLTILWQDNNGGLQVRNLTDHTWMDAPSIPGTFVINLGDALEHATDGVYRATPHRVLQRTHALTNRISFPYFFDPPFDAQLMKVQIKGNEDAIVISSADNAKQRWDNADPRQFTGTYGSYLLRKVSRAFPELFEEVVQSHGVALPDGTEETGEL